MKSFQSFLEARAFSRKGWVNLKNGKMVLWAFRGGTIRPFHDEYVVQNAKKFFRGGEEELLRRFAAMSGFEPEDDETISMWVDIKTGKVDRDPNLDSVMEEDGWRRVVFDEGLSFLETMTRAEGQRAAKIIMSKMRWDQIQSISIYDQGHLNDPIEIYNEEDFASYAKTGRVAKRTDIGRTMAMFREEIDRDEFRAHWKKAPMLTTGGGNVKHRNAFWDSYFQHFEDKYGEIPKRIKDAMRMSDMKPNPSITYKGKKFSMRTGMDEMDLLYHVLSESVVNEAKMRGVYFKGWMTPRGKVVLHATTPTGTSKYHIQILTDIFSFEKMRPHMGEWVGAEHLKFLQRLKKDGTADFTDDQVEDLIEKQYKSVYKQWANGTIDQDRGVEEKFMKMGWVKIWIDRNQYGMSMIQGNDKRKTLECAKKLDKQFGGWDGFMTKSMTISTQTDIGARIGSAIRDSAGWDNYLRTGEVRRHQTEIGRKMAMFREWNENKDLNEYHWLLPDYPEQLPDSEDEGGWAMGDPAVPIKWTGDHMKIYRKVMQHRKKNNPKYNEPKETHDDVSEDWSEKYKRSIDCNNPKGFSQRAHCQGRKKRLSETIVHRADKWIVMDKNQTKILGTHTSEAKAKAQLAAIEISKARRGK